jgi:hypothetical protein
MREAQTTKLEFVIKTSPRNSVQIVILLAVLSLLTFGSLAHCATITWINTSGGKWSVAANWSPNQVPTNLVSPTTWSAVFPLPVIVSGLNTVTNPIAGTQLFYRLNH